MKSSERVYLRLMDSTNCDAFWTNWFDVSGRIILYPECRCSKEGEKEKGSRITDFASYLKLDVLSLLELYKEPELAGDVFSSTVLNCLEEVSYDTEELLSLFREVFENYKIIPATCYSKEGDVKSYISFTEVENAYQAIFNRQDIRLLYNFVTDYPETYFLTKEVCSKFGIIYNELSVFNLEEAVKSTYSISSFALDKRYAEEFLLKLITSQNYNGMKTCPIFPANDGRFVRLSDQNTFLDIREDKRVRIVPSSKACSIIEIESSALRINFELYYKGQCITKENFLEKYLSYSSSYDSYVIFDNSLYWSRPEVKSLLKEKKWYERGGAYYSAGEMLVASRISDATLEAIGARCLLLSEATVDNDPYLKKLYEKGFIARRLSEVPEGILINDCYPDAFSILLTDSNGNIDKNRTLEIFNQLIELETRIDDKSHPLYRWGMFLKDLVTTSEFIEKEKLNELFIKYNRLVSGRRNSTLIESACTDMIKALDSQVEKRQELFFYLLTYVENGALFKLNAKELSNVEFPSEDRRWKKLSLLCDPRKIVSIEKASKLHHNINPDIFSLETEGPSIVVIRRKEALLSRLEKLFPNAAKPLLGMLLFLTNTREGKAEAQNLDFAGSEENYYLKVLQSSYRHVDFLTNHYKGHPASEVFSSASVNYKRPTIEYTEEEKEGEIEITSITGARIKVRLAEEAQRDTAFSRLESYSDCRFEVFLNRLESGRNTDSQVVELIQKILELVYGQTKSFREALLELVGISKKEMDKTQFLVRSELVNVLKQISRSRSTNYGAEIAHYIDSYQKLDRSLHAASYENKRNPEAEKRKEEITNQIARKLTEDRCFASYVLEAMCRHMQSVSYAPENVPYEFFQNADDACLQRSTYEKAEEDYYYDIRFTDAGLLVIEHNGRPINKCPEGREYEDWRNDFINMLSFSSSKGGDEDNRETGKFGFGFKSCYFLTDEPKVYSANLSARIVAGIYPVYTDPDNRLSSSVTRFVLPVKNSMQAEIKDIMASFKRDIPSMLLFAKAIRRITINGESYEKKILASAEGYKIVSIGNLVYLLLDGEHGQIAFSLSENRIRTLDTKMKKLWCTTPLGITSATSYLVNSTEFIIDVGRNQLAMNIPGNKRLVTGYFASKMTALLIDLYEKKLPMEVGRYLEQGEEGTKLLLEAIASSSEDEIFTPIFEKTYSAFVSKYDKCYSGKDFRHIDSETCCVRLDNLNSENTTRKELFNQILDLVNEHYKCSHSFIFFTKKAFVPFFCNPEVPEGIGTLIRKLIKGYSDKLSVSTQLKLSRLMVMSGYPMDFTGFKFESEAGSYEYPTSLVWKSEGYLYELAPRDKRAREEYEYEGRYCFNSSEVASWIIEVKEDKRDIAMRVFSDNVSSLVSEKHTLTNSRCWLSSSWRRHLSLVDSSYLPLLEGFFKVSPVLSNSEKDEYVKRVYETWDRLTDKERQEAIENYRENTYGKRRLELRGDSDDWYQLLYITVLGSMGRFRSKAHINFVNRFMAKKYSSDNYLDYKNTDMFENPKVMNDWLNYMIRTPMNEEGSGYEEWRKYLPFFAQISYSASILHEYLTKEPMQGSYYYSLSYNKDPELSGAGFIEPDFKHALGRFYPMVLRELISNNCSGLDEQVRELMNRESFYPNRELREILSLEEEGRIAAKQFYEKCYSFMNKNQRYVRYLFDGSYPFYYYQYQKDNAGRSIDFDLYGSGEES